MTPGGEWQIRRPAVAGTFYPAVAARLESLVHRQLDAAAEAAEAAQAAAGSAAEPAAGAAGVRASSLAGVLVPHAGLVYSGTVAAAAWRLVGERLAAATGPATVVLLGTNHGAGWLDGIGVWDAGSWLTPFGAVEVDADLAAAVLDLRPALGPGFSLDRAAHLDEHSIEVQLPFLHAVAPAARIVPLAVSTGTGEQAVAAGRSLGRLLAAKRAAGEAVVLAISSDMAHYPPADVCAAATKSLLPPIVALDSARLAMAEATLRRSGVRGLLCGMCGIEPAVVGLAALAAMEGITATPLLAATSADAGGAPDRTVGYLSVAFG